MTLNINIVVEGLTDEAVVRRICGVQGFAVQDVYGKQGKDYINKKILAFDNAAREYPWLVMRDLDHDAECPPELKQNLLPNISKYLIFVIAVREVEAWLLSDPEVFSQFFGVARSAIPANPEWLVSPKSTVIDLIKKSRKKDIRKDMAPRPGSGIELGPAYASRLSEFANTVWRPHVAESRSSSLSYCMKKLQHASRTFRQ